MPVREPAHGLDAAGDEHVALAGLDRVRGHADGLQRRRAVAVDGDARRAVEARRGARRPAPRCSPASPAGCAQPQMTSSTSAGSSGRRPSSSSACTIVAPRSSGRQSTSEPLLARPIGRAGGGDDDGFHVGPPGLGPRERPAPDVVGKTLAVGAAGILLLSFLRGLRADLEPGRPRVPGRRPPRGRRRHRVGHVAVPRRRVPPARRRRASSTSPRARSARCSPGPIGRCWPRSRAAPRWSGTTGRRSSRRGWAGHRARARRAARERVAGRGAAARRPDWSGGSFGQTGLGGFVAEVALTPVLALTDGRDGALAGAVHRGADAREARARQPRPAGRDGRGAGACTCTGSCSTTIPGGYAGTVVSFVTLVRRPASGTCSSARACRRSATGWARSRSWRWCSQLTDSPIAVGGILTLRLLPRRSAARSRPGRRALGPSAHDAGDGPHPRRDGLADPVRPRALVDLPLGLPARGREHRVPPRARLVDPRSRRRQRRPPARQRPHPRHVLREHPARRRAVRGGRRAADADRPPSVRAGVLHRRRHVRRVVPLHRAAHPARPVDGVRGRVRPSTPTSASATRSAIPLVGGGDARRARGVARARRALLARHRVRARRAARVRRRVRRAHRAVRRRRGARARRAAAPPGRRPPRRAPASALLYIGVVVALFSLAPALWVALFGAVAFGAGAAFSLAAGMGAIQSSLDGRRAGARVRRVPRGDARRARRSPRSAPASPATCWPTCTGRWSAHSSRRGWCCCARASWCSPSASARAGPRRRTHDRRDRHRQRRRDPADARGRARHHGGADVARRPTATPCARASATLGELLGDDPGHHVGAHPGRVRGRDPGRARRAARPRARADDRVGDERVARRRQRSRRATSASTCASSTR